MARATTSRSDLRPTRIMPEYCVVTQRSGPLVKTYTTDRRSRVQWAARQQCRGSPFPAPLMWGSSEEKLELYLALFGYTGAHYVLTYRDEDLPADFGGVRSTLDAFRKRVHRWNPQIRRYVYTVEAGHEHGRWHIHFVADERELPMVAVQALWRYGFVNPGYLEYPVLCKTGGYRRLAHYFCKRDTMIPLGRHPWGVAKGMRQLIPQSTVRVQGRRPAVPRDTFWLEERAGPEIKLNRQSGGRFDYIDWVAAPKAGAYTFLANRMREE